MTVDNINPPHIFFPYAFERQMNVKSQGTRFVHYTRADAAMNIIKTEAVWMRKTSCMNDFMEVEHGLQCLLNAYSGEVGVKLKETLEPIFPSVTGEIEALFNGWISYLRADTYVTCFSEHLADEDSFGRLSMWRAYGATTGVALVVNNTPFLSPSNALKAYSSPVAYLDEKAFQQQLAKMVDRIKGAADWVREQGREILTGYIFNVFKFATLCTKHPGFREEME